MELELFVCIVIIPAIALFYIVVSCWDTFRNAWLIDKFKREEDQEIKEV